MRKIAMILHTNGIEYDDRIRKEMLTVMKLYPDIKFKIFAIIDGDSDMTGEGVSDYGVEYCIPKLASRTKYKSGTHLLAKAYDFYKTVNPMLKDFDALWVANERVFFFVALCCKPIIWDWHELPMPFLRHGYMKILLCMLMKRCKAIVHANPERIVYIDSIHGLSNKEKQFVIHNYPNFNEADKQTDEKFAAFKSWLDGDDCIYLQGAGNEARCGIESVRGIMAIDNLKAVVVGKFDDKLRKQLQKEFGDEFENRLFFTGMVRQQMTPHYIRCCKASLVLYRKTKPNNFYCEPNRMFQSIINECPVVVGCNPPMKELVEKYHFGVVLEDDGTNVTGITDGIKAALANHNCIVEDIKKNKDKILWDSQDEVFHKIIKETFDS